MVAFGLRCSCMVNESKVQQRICSVDGCHSPAPRMGLCNKHYSRNYRYGDVNFTKRRRYDHSKETCEFPKCGKPVHARGYCNACYVRIFASSQAQKAQQRYRCSRKAKETRRRYYQSARGKRYLKERCERRRQSPQNKEWFRKYWQSPKGKMVRRNADHKRRERVLNTRNAPTADFLLDLWNRTTHCAICSISLGDDKELDHIKPLCEGGLHVPENVRYIHRSCNRRRPRRPIHKDAP
jgi:HNH endonuclease